MHYMHKRRIIKGMKRFLVIVLGAMLVLALTACGDSQKVINVYNWGVYIDESVLKEFETRTGYKVNYETFQTNEEMYAKLKNGGTSYDIIIPSDYMIEKMIKEDMLLEIDLNKVPNYKNIDAVYKNLAFDPDNKYSVPYFWGTVGIVYNTNEISDEIDSWTALWNEKYSKQIAMVDSQRDALMIALKILGYSMNTRDESQLDEAKELLIKQKPLVLAYAGDSIKDLLIGEQVSIAAVWSGEAANIIMENPHFRYVIPSEGTNLWFDSIVIPKGAKNIEAAHMFVDFLCDPEIAQKNAEYVGYATCNTETKKLLDPALFPTTHAYPLEEWYLDKAEVFVDPGDFIKVYDRIWTEIKAK